MLIISARPSPSGAHSSQLSPPRPSPKEKATFHSALSQHCLSSCLGWRLLIGKNAHCLLSVPVFQLFFGDLAVLLQRPASVSCRASILNGMSILGLQVSRSPHLTWLLKTRPMVQHRKIVQYHPKQRPAPVAVMALLDVTVGNGPHEHHQHGHIQGPRCWDSPSPPRGKVSKASRKEALTPECAPLPGKCA